MKHPRAAIATLTLSAAGFVGLVMHEGWSDVAIIPVKGDVPTVGPGLTKRPDGTPVQMGDSVTPPEGIKRSYAHISKDESVLKGCVKAPLYQWEYDTLVSHAYQYGPGKTCASEVVKLANLGRYEESCRAHLNWKMVAGKDCSIRANGCYGVWKRSQERMQQCLG